jgi:hypothetical protein
VCFLVIVERSVSKGRRRRCEEKVRKIGVSSSLCYAEKVPGGRLTSKLTFTPLSLCSISTPPAEPPAPLELPLGLAFRAELLLVVAGVVYSCLNSSSE